MGATPVPFTLSKVVIISVSLTEETKKNARMYLKGRALALCLFFCGRKLCVLLARSRIGRVFRW